MQSRTSALDDSIPPDTIATCWPRNVLFVHLGIEGKGNVVLSQPNIYVHSRGETLNFKSRFKYVYQVHSIVFPYKH